MPSANFTDTKILVILIKDGGEDSLAGLFPRDPARIEEIGYPGKGGVNWRPTLGQTPLEVAGYTGGFLGADWCLHPSRNLIKEHLWDTNDLAVVHRVGTMFSNLAGRTMQDIRRATIRGNTGDIELPIGLGAHDFAQLGSVSMITRDFVDQFGMPRTIGEGGFIGRLAQAFAAFTPSLGSPAGPPSVLPISYAVGQLGSARNLISRVGLTRALDLPIVGGRYNRAWSVSAQNTDFLAAIDAINLLSQTESRRRTYRDVAEIMRQSVAFFNPVIQNAGGFAVDTHFSGAPIGGWRGILRTFARSIEQRVAGLGLPRRMVFIGNINGYDTHFSQGKTTGPLPTLFLNEAQALRDFRNAMGPSGLNIWNDVLVTDWSEFARTLIENGSSGTDHSWARTCLVTGGAVLPGHYGTPPTSYGVTTYNTMGETINAGGSHDVNGGELGGGSLAPAISAEQYWQTILTWFGADSNDLTAALPRRAQFGAPIAFI